MPKMNAEILWLKMMDMFSDKNCLQKIAVYQKIHRNFYIMSYFEVLPKPPVRKFSAQSSVVMPKGMKIP